MTEAAVGTVTVPCYYFGSGDPEDSGGPGSAPDVTTLAAGVLRSSSVVDALWERASVDPKARTQLRDLLDEIPAAGASAVVQPGGSVRDAEVIAAADEHGRK